MSARAIADVIMQDIDSAIDMQSLVQRLVASSRGGEEETTAVVHPDRIISFSGAPTKLPQQVPSPPSHNQHAHHNHHSRAQHMFSCVCVCV